MTKKKTELDQMLVKLRHMFDEDIFVELLVNEEGKTRISQMRRRKK